MARGLPQQREIADLVSNPGTNLCEIGAVPASSVLYSQRAISSSACT